MFWSSKSLVTRSLRGPVQASKPNNSRKVLQSTRREPFWLTSMDRRMPATTSTGSLVFATIIPSVPLPDRLHPAVRQRQPDLYFQSRKMPPAGTSGSRMKGTGGVPVWLRLVAGSSPRHRPRQSRADQERQNPSSIAVFGVSSHDYDFISF